jgi:hypothetical protein
LVPFISNTSNSVLRATRKGLFGRYDSSMAMSERQRGQGRDQVPRDAAQEDRAAIRIDLTRQRRASCAVDGRRYTAKGPAPIYKLGTLLYLCGHAGEAFEVHDDRSPTGGPGGLAMRGKIKNWAWLKNGRIKFCPDAKPAPVFSPAEVDFVAKAAGQVSGVGQEALPSSRKPAQRVPGLPESQNSAETAKPLTGFATAESEAVS